MYFYIYLFIYLYIYIYLFLIYIYIIIIIYISFKSPSVPFGTINLMDDHSYRSIRQSTMMDPKKMIRVVSCSRQMAIVDLMLLMLGK